MDLAIHNKTRSNYAKVKIEVNLIGEFPKKVNVQVRKKTGEVVEKYISIRYDDILKYHKTYKLQDHNKKDYFI